MRPLIRILSRNLADDDIFVQAAAVAYAAVFSVFPLLVIVIALLSLFVDRTQAQEAAVAILQPYLPHEALTLVADTLKAIVRTRGTVGAVASVGLLWSATTVAGSLRHALNRVLRADRSRGFFRQKLVELIIVLLGGGFMSLSVIIPIVAAAIASVPQVAEAEAMVGAAPGVAVVTALGPWLLSALAFFMVYSVLPNVRMAWSSLLVGTTLAVLLFEATRRAFFWYLSTLATYPIVYGPLAGLIVFMAWVYLVAVLVLLSAEIMWLMESRHRGERSLHLLPEAQATAAGSPSKRGARLDRG
jgi:membrane protein